MDRPFDRFTKRFRAIIREFAARIEGNDHDLAVAISRKGPRLLLLIDQDPDLPSVEWSRYVSEKALAFLDPSEIADSHVALIDDVIIYGSTFAGVRRDLQTLGATVEGYVLALSRGAHSEIATDVTPSIRLDEKSVAEFVDLEVQAFGSLGVPYDIDHPILRFPFEGNLAALVQGWIRDGRSVEEDSTRWHTAGGVTALRCAVDTAAKDHSFVAYKYGPSTVRVFVDSARRAVNVVPIFCVALSESQLLDEHLFDKSPGPLGELWRATLAMATNSPLPASKRYQALMSAAHYLASFELGTRWMRTELSPVQGIHPAVSERDLKLLFGPRLGSVWVNSLNHTFEEVTVPSLPASFTIRTNELPASERELRVLARTEKGSRFLAVSNRYLAFTSGAEPRETLAAILEAQRFVWDEATREDGPLDGQRLEVALSYPAIRDLIELSGVQLSDSTFQRTCNSSIDAGLAVPRYIRLPGREGVWVRGIRFGENLSHDHKTKYWLDYVIEKASSVFQRRHGTKGQTGIPWFVFEKLLVLLRIGLDSSLADELDQAIEIGFDEFGARCVLVDYPGQPYFVDWALGSGMFQSEEMGLRRYSGAVGVGRVLSRNLAVQKLLDPSRNPLDHGLLDRTAALIETFISIDSSFKGAERMEILHALSTCRDEDGYLSAVSKEIELWLFDTSLNASRLAVKLSELSALADSSLHLGAESGKLDALLGKSAHLLSETDLKKAAYEKRPEILTKIDTTLSETGPLAHCAPFWLNTIRPRVEVAPPEHRKTERHLRFAALVAGKALSIARTVLTDTKLVHHRKMDSLKPMREHVALFNEYIQNARELGFQVRFPSEPNLSILETSSRADRLGEAARVLEDTRGTILDIWSTWRYPASSGYIAPFENDQAIMLWDLTGSSGEEALKPELETIHLINERLRVISIRESAQRFSPNQDDGNGLVCGNVSSALRMFKAISELYQEHGFEVRAGVETTIANEKLWRNSRTGHFGGRPYQVSARLRDFFKEVPRQNQDIKYQPADGSRPGIVAPSCSFVVLSERAGVSIETVDSETFPNWLALVGSAERYVPRTASTLPMRVSIYSLFAESRPVTVTGSLEF